MVHDFGLISGTGGGGIGAGEEEPALERGEQEGEQGPGEQEAAVGGGEAEGGTRPGSSGRV